MYMRGTYADQGWISSHHLLEHGKDFLFHLADVLIDGGDGTGRLIGVEVAVEVDFVADLADLEVLLVISWVRLLSSARRMRMGSPEMVRTLLDG